jgi:hypothetical protein
MDNRWEKTAERLEEMILDDPAGRGVRYFSVPGELAGAARSLMDSQRVIIITGFYILSAAAAESDGPPGAVVLARALRRLGKEVLLVTDTANAAVVRAAVTALDGDISVEVFSPDAKQEDYLELLERFQPTHVITVERPGRAQDNCYYTMRGDDISAMTAGLDWLVLLAGSFQAVTIGMGDGGNEIGMGRVRDQVAQHVPFGEQIACAVETDYIITAGVTNWAAYALVTLLAIAAAQPLLHSPEEEGSMLEAMTRAGCVDGNLCRPADSIDAVPLADHQARIRTMAQMIAE